jgi:hypothetical protein
MTNSGWVVTKIYLPDNVMLTVRPRAAGAAKTLSLRFKPHPILLLGAIFIGLISISSRNPQRTRRKI